MAINPFIITEKIIPQYFCDREKESAQLTKLLVNGNNVVLISPRRMGKTALIQFCYNNSILKKEFITIYVDILSTTNLKEFTFLLGREIFESVKSRGVKVWKSFVNIVKSFAAKISVDPLSGLPSFNLQLGDITEPEYSLKEIFNYLGSASKPCILAIDEFQQITRYPEKNVEALIRSHILQINNCRMIFSGSQHHILADMFTSNSRPFYQSASFIELQQIPKEIYSEFIIKMFEQGHKKISKELTGRIYDMFDGITYYVQRVCNSLYSDTSEKEKADEKLLDDALNDILASYDLIFRLRLSQYSTRQKELLFAVARENIVDKITSVEFLQKYSLISASAVQTSLKSLLKNETIVRNEKGYIIDDRFFRMWILRNF